MSDRALPPNELAAINERVRAIGMTPSTGDLQAEYRARVVRRLSILREFVSPDQMIFLMQMITENVAPERVESTLDGLIEKAINGSLFVRKVADFSIEQAPRLSKKRSKKSGKIRRRDIA